MVENKSRFNSSTTLSSQDVYNVSSILFDSGKLIKKFEKEERGTRYKPWTVDIHDKRNEEKRTESHMHTKQIVVTASQSCAINQDPLAVIIITLSSDHVDPPPFAFVKPLRLVNLA